LNVKIIEAGVEHVDAVAPLFDSYRQFYRQPSDLPGAREFLHARLSNRESVVFLAANEDVSPAAALGFVQLYPSFSSVGMKRIWILNDLFVTEEARRSGIAGLLMNAALDLARSTGAARIELATAKDNVAAKSLYLALGYRIVEEFDRLELKVSPPSA
jgi:ribosomal protein S18 acetylase RimI-like enzyme